MIVPDMLGYGGTSKPTEVEAYFGSGMSRDVVEIMNTEGVQEAIAIGHDWSVVTYHLVWSKQSELTRTNAMGIGGVL